LCKRWFGVQLGPNQPVCESVNIEDPRRGLIRVRYDPERIVYREPAILSPRSLYAGLALSSVRARSTTAFAEI